MNQESCPFSLKIHTVVDTYAIHLCVQRDGELSEKFAVFKGMVKFKGPVNDCMYFPFLESPHLYPSGVEKF